MLSGEVKKKNYLPFAKNRIIELDFCLTVHHQLSKVIQKNQLDATMIY